MSRWQLMQENELRELKKVQEAEVDDHPDWKTYFKSLRDWLTSDAVYVCHPSLPKAPEPTIIAPVPKSYLGRLQHGIQILNELIPLMENAPMCQQRLKVMLESHEQTRQALMNDQDTINLCALAMAAHDDWKDARAKYLENLEESV